MESAPASEGVGDRLNRPFNDQEQFSASAGFTPLIRDNALTARRTADVVTTRHRDPKGDARQRGTCRTTTIRTGGSPATSIGATFQLCGAPDHEAAAAAMEGTGDYRVLRRIRPREVQPGHQLAPGEAIAVIVDVETTGLDHRRDEVIELGMVAFVYDQHGQLGPVVGTLSQLRQPSLPIPSEITRLTGISDDLVAGQMLDLDAVRALIGPASLVVAHHAGFDRPFCEGLDATFRDKGWACSMREVPWIDLGYEGAKLGHLTLQAGRFHRGHRAVDDCHALLELLASSRDGSDSALRHLLASAGQPRIRLWATASPFDRKDALRARGYRWNNGDDGRARSWWTEVVEDALDEELRFLREEIYRRPVDLPHEIVTAHERYRAG